MESVLDDEKLERLERLAERAEVRKRDDWVGRDDPQRADAPASAASMMSGYARPRAVGIRSTGTRQIAASSSRSSAHSNFR